MWRVALISIVVAVALESGIFLLLWAVAVPRPGPNGGPALIDPLDIIKTTITVAGSVGAVLVGVYGYRKQRTVEGDGHRADAEQLAQRYTTAAEQLGHEKAAVRLAGIYAMARLADDWSEQRQVCIDVLCAYLRMPYEPDATSEKYREGEREVRLTIIRVIRDHLQDPAAPTAWCGRDLDFTHTIFDGGDFGGAKFTGGVISFYGAKFSGGWVSFDGAEFTGGAISFCDAKFADAVSFNDVKFAGGEVFFSGAAFTAGGAVSFDEVKFARGTVSFSNAVFTGGEVSFYGAEFAGSTISFSEAEFSGGTVSFLDAKSTGGTVSFVGAVFTTSRSIAWGPFEPPK